MANLQSIQSAPEVRSVRGLRLTTEHIKQKTSTSKNMTDKQKKANSKLAQAAILVLAAFVVLYYLVYFATEITFNILLVIKIVVAAIVGYFAIGILANELKMVLSKTSGLERGTTVATAFRYISYLVFAFVVLGLAGVSGTALLAGGTFTGLVLGLASQQTLSNIFAGLLILTSRPFLVGNRITLSTWQWGFALPSYPPKFLSDNLLIPGYTGTIEDIRLNYTTIRLDEGVQVKVPNSIVIQASVVDHSVEERVVRVRYDVPKPVDTPSVVRILHDVVARNEWVAKPESVTVYVENIRRSM